ncbi:hypothetical protein [Candidatus Methylomirabilis sp.]|uniref:Uncharacterized protein n=1 Tax=Candidatus Methylomirabilis tolerans TaxID=3123416 RepID=A0AAJ1AG94_9BACT|nr:hypothetical protein [Candidatus Methylomirabilis sp.]
MTLDRYRSVINPSYTVPIGYSQLADKAGINAHYLRRAVLPTLALRGLIAIAAKGFDGTIYQLRCDHRVIELIVSATTQIYDAELPSNRPPELAYQHDSAPSPSSLPDWVNREKWGTLAPDTIQRLIDRSGSEEQAREVLEIIVYNETHGPERSRVRNRLSVLSRYLSSPNAEIWPADDGYETISLRNARLERDRALKEKALAEEALKARQEERRLRFLSSLTDGQMAWIKHEAKNTVDHSPGSRQGFIKTSTRLAHYKAEEEKFIAEWLERTAYGESVPEHA